MAYTIVYSSIYEITPILANNMLSLNLHNCCNVVD